MNYYILKITKTIFSFLFCSLLFTECTFSQNSIYPYNKWTKEELSLAATFHDFQNFSDVDTAVLFYCNLARINPKLFRDTYLKEYCESDSLRDDPLDLSKSSYYKSLCRDLSSLKKGEPLFPQKDLCEIASNHAETMGKKGKTGHDNYEKRFKAVNSKYNQTGENCDYGNDNPLDIVMSLLIDDGVPSLGHRKNILSKEYNCYGGSLKDHTKFQYNYVMDFGFDPTLIKPKKRKGLFSF